MVNSGFNVQLLDTSDLTDNFNTIIKNIEVTRRPVVRLYAVFIVIAISDATVTLKEGILGLLTFITTCMLSVFFGKGVSSKAMVTLFAFT